jgi:hypothetical protein
MGIQSKGNSNKVKSLNNFTLLYDDICSIIEDAREQAYRAVNVSLTLRNWMLGERIAREKLDGEDRAEYGKQVIDSLAKELTNKYGKGFGRALLYEYIKFYRSFPEIVYAVSGQLEKVGAASQQSENVHAVSGQSEILNAVSTKSKLSLSLSGKILPWTHYRELIRVDDPVARKWYEQEALKEVWGTRTLPRNITTVCSSRLTRKRSLTKCTSSRHLCNKISWSLSRILLWQSFLVYSQMRTSQNQNWKAVSSTIYRNL